MIEYLYNAIMATSGQDIEINAVITDIDSNYITEGCALMLHNNDGMICRVEGEYSEVTNEWSFIVPASETEGLTGRYWYYFCKNDVNICFKEPIYLV